MENLGFSATRGEGWRAANVICGHTLDQCQGKGEKKRKERIEGRGVIRRSEGAEAEAENGLRAQKVMMVFPEAFEKTFHIHFSTLAVCSYYLMVSETLGTQTVKCSLIKKHLSKIKSDF